MTSANNDSAEELAELMKQLSAQNGLLRSHLLDTELIQSSVKGMFLLH